MNEIKLIALYYYICERYDTTLYPYCQRHTKNHRVADFTDEELLTIYLFTMIEEDHFKIKAIHRYAQKYLISWFPRLPSYQAFNRRLNHLGDALWVLMCDLLKTYRQSAMASVELGQVAVDSFLIILAKNQRGDRAKVAVAIADKGRCASKGIWYHGLKLHCLALLRPGQLPLALDLLLSAASENDNTVFKEQMAPAYRHLTVFADKIYDDVPSVNHLAEQQNIQLLAGQRRRPYQKALKADQKILSDYVSRK